MAQERNYCVKNMQKRHRADIHGLQLEANREVQDENWYNSKVNLALSYLNVYLIKCNDWYAEINDVIEKADVKVKVDSVVAVTSVYTVSADWIDTHSKAELMEYFRKCLEYEKTKGEVISAVIHFDETTPHMHTCTVPIIQAPDIKNVYVYKKDDIGQTVFDENDEPVVERDSKGRKKRRKEYVYDENGNMKTHKALSANALFGNKAHMSLLQSEFYEVCGKPFGMERGKIRVNDTERVKRKSELEFREAMVAEAMAKNTEDEIKIKKSKKELEKKHKIADDAVEVAAQFDNNLDILLAEQERIQAKAIEDDEAYYGELADVYLMKQELEKKMADVSSLIAEISEFKEIAAMSEQNRRTMWMESHKVGGKTLNELYREDLQKKQAELIAKAEGFDIADVMEGLQK